MNNFRAIMGMVRNLGQASKRFDNQVKEFHAAVEEIQEPENLSLIVAMPDDWDFRHKEAWVQEYGVKFGGKRFV